MSVGRRDLAHCTGRCLVQGSCPRGKAMAFWHRLTGAAAHEVSLVEVLPATQFVLAQPHDGLLIGVAEVTVDLGGNFPVAIL